MASRSEDQQALFDVSKSDETHTAARVGDARVLRNLRAFVAPIAHDAAAVTDDPRTVALARDLMSVFADHAGLYGMTRAELTSELSRRGHIDLALIDSRFDLFVRMGLVKPYLAKKHQSRYVLDPAGLAGLLVFERLGMRGGVDEMIALLDRARWLLERGETSRAEVTTLLGQSRQILAAYAAELRRLVDSAPLGELIEEQRRHDPGRVEEQVHLLNRLVTERFAGDHELGDLAFAVVEAQLAYRDRVLDAVGRVLDEGGASLDFSVLTPEQYLDAAINASRDELAEVGNQLVADPPLPWLDPGTIVDALDEYRPQRRARVRPEEPVPGHAGDPIEAIQAAQERQRRRRRLAAEANLGDGDSVDLTLTLRWMAWPEAAQWLVGLLGLSSDESEPFTVELGLQPLIDFDAKVTYLHAVMLRRNDAPSGGASLESGDEVSHRHGTDS